MLKLLIFSCVVAAATIVTATPVGGEQQQDSSIAKLVEEMRGNCDNGMDSLACVKFKVMTFLETIFKKDYYQITNDVEVRSNGNVIETVGRSQNDDGFLAHIENYLSSHDITFKFPNANAQVTVQPRNNDEINLKVSYPFSGLFEARKSKLKKIAVPLMVIILLKAMTVIPMALGILGLKAWNSLQLGFVSFVVSVGLAIFQLCKKIASDHHHAHIAAHGPWDGRNLPTDDTSRLQFDAQNLAYQAYA